MHAVTKMPKTLQFRQADFAWTNWNGIRQSRKIHEQSLRLTKFRQISHFCYCVHFWT